MGGTSQFFDFNQANTSRKFSTQKRHNDGFEAPRNSLEFPMEASQSYHFIHEDIPYSCQVKHPSMKMNIYPSETSMKMSDGEQSNRSNYQYNAPSVVARLMGMSSLPSEKKVMVHEKECIDERLRNDIPRKFPIEISTNHNMSLSSTPFKQTKQELLSYGIKRDSSQHTKNPRLTKPQPREHPQEELLQKFKKDFEAWQTSKVWEHSRTLAVDNNIRQVKDNKTLAQENLNKLKMARYADAKRNSAHDPEPRYGVSTTKPKIATQPGGGLQYEGYIHKQRQLISKGDVVLRNRAKSDDMAHLSVGRLDKKLARSSSPTRIVILKPSSEGSSDIEESLGGSSKIPEKEGSMEAFLEEVKERLRFEIQGKATARVIGTETSFSGRSTDPKQIARNIAKQIRESVTTELGTTLVRSESTRSYRSEVQFNGPDSPEFINRDTRKLVSERMKNVLKNETEVRNHVIADGRTGNSLFKKDGLRLRPMYDFSETGKKVSYWEDKKAQTESNTRSFRREQQNGAAFDAESSSPRNLVRSFSAPVSGTAFGKLLLEDKHVLTGAHIRRKHEASELTSAEVGKNRKDGFNLIDRVSNLRQNFNLKGKLFRKRIQSIPISDANDFDPMEAITTTPSVVMTFSSKQDNFTEVPPSPASVSSSSHDDFCRPGHPSPDSPLEVPFMDDHPSLESSKEFFSEFPEPKCLSEQVESGGSEEATVLGDPCEDETIEAGGHLEAYVREILVAAGLYKGQAFDQAYSRLDSLTRPISNWVFEKVEEASSRNENVDDAGSFLLGDTDLGHKTVFDLINEALPRVIGAPTASSMFRKWVMSPGTMPRGRRLLNDVLHQIRTYTSPEVDESHSLDSTMAWDLRTTPWPSMSHEGIEVMGREMECVIMGELINELVWDMCS